MSKKYDFDYIIIGSGPAGSTAALALASSSKSSVAIIESYAIGGNHLNTRDIPYTLSLNFSHLFAKLSHYPEINGHDIHYNFPTAVSHQDRITSSLVNDHQKALKDSGIKIINGQAHFLDKHTVAVGKKQFTAGTFIIATGAKLNTASIAGLDTVSYLTPDNIFKIRRLPKYLLVVGGGPTGCEIAEYFAELGTKVIILEQSDRILPKEDIETSAIISDYFTKKLGMLIIRNAKVVALEQDHSSKKVIYHDGKQEKTIRIEHIVLATGAIPSLDFSPENAGIKYKSTGIIVDSLFQTSAKNIYAVGDCLGGRLSSAEHSEYQASLLASNLLTKSKNLSNLNGFIRIVNTYPEIATVGLSEATLIKRKRKYKKAIVPLKDLIVSKTEHLEHGFVKIMVDRSNHILGATIVMPHAALMAEEFALAIRHRLTILEIASTPHLVNSFNYAIKLAAKQLIK